VTTILVSGMPASWVTYPQAISPVPGTVTEPTTASAVAPEFRTTSEPSSVVTSALSTGQTILPEFA
jgi:hypothetical protein